MIHPITKLYESESINRVVLGLMHLRVPITGKLKSIHLYWSSISGTGTWKFDINHSGTPLFPSFDDMLTLSSLTLSDSKTGLSIPVIKGQVINLDLKQKGFGRLFGPAALILNIDDEVAVEATLSDLLDVDASSPNDSDVLSYDINTETWVASPIPSGVDSIGDLNDVNLDGIEDGQVLAWNNTESEFVPVDQPSGGGAEELSDLSDVDTTSVSDGDILVFNSGVWTPEAPSGGGGNGIEIWYPDAPYSTPSAFDDEFNGTSLDAKWSIFNSGFTTAFNDPPTMMRCSPTANEFRGIYQEVMTSGSDCDFVMKVHKPKYNAGWNFLGFLIYTSDNIRYEISITPTNSIEMDGAYSLKRFLWLTNSSIYSETSLATGVSVGNVPLYMRLKYTHSSTRYELFLSENGIQWARFMNETGLSGWPQRVGILNRGNSIEDRLAGRVDFFRALQENTLGRKITI